MDWTWSLTLPLHQLYKAGNNYRPTLQPCPQILPRSPQKSTWQGVHFIYVDLSPLCLKKNQLINRIEECSLNEMNTILEKFCGNTRVVSAVQVNFILNRKRIHVCNWANSSSNKATNKAFYALSSRKLFPGQRVLGLTASACVNICIFLRKRPWKFTCIANKKSSLVLHFI